MPPVKRPSRARPLPPSPQDQAYRRLRREMATVGFPCPGTLTRQRLACGKPSCWCRRKRPYGHGPYVYWTRKVQGRTQSRMIPKALVGLYREGIRNHRRLRMILKRMEDLSVRALAAAKKRIVG